LVIDYIMSCLSLLNRVSEIESSKDIIGRLHCQSSGVICPLHGVMLLNELFEDTATLIVGAPECVYYPQVGTLIRLDNPTLSGIYTYVMDENDVVFGSADGLKIAAQAVLEDPEIAALFLVSSCVFELIGDDLRAISADIANALGKPVFPVHTSNYDHHCPDYFKAIERMLEAIAPVLSKQETIPHSVNLLGRIFHGNAKGSLRQSELGAMLEKNGVTINMEFPSRVRLEHIKQLTAAELNIVTDRVGIRLAKIMQEKYGIPYVLFESTFSHQTIEETYLSIGRFLRVAWQDEVSRLSAHTKERISEVSCIVEGETIIAGCLPPDPFQSVAFLSKLKMKPLVVASACLSRGSEEAIANLLKAGEDPYVIHACEREPMEEALKTLRPRFYVGHAPHEKVSALGIRHIGCFMAEPEHLGFRSIDNFLLRLESAAMQTPAEKGCD
jgi:nitrogenase molybdenum-cofactor synthesis protein NifE